MEPRQPSALTHLTVHAAYAAAAAVGWPVYLYLLATRPKYRAHLAERWGLVPRHEPGRERFWVHAISVGEVEAARTFVPALREAYPEAEVVLTTTTLTGRRRAVERFPDLPVHHFPLDLGPCVAAALDRVRPTAVILVEPEWWPNFFMAAVARGIPLIGVNVRLTERAARGYGRIRPLMRQVFNCCRAIGVQAEVYRRRLVDLGTDPDRIRVTGQMKHDAVTFADTVPGAEALARAVGLAPGEPVLVAGSTGPGEEAALVAAYRAVRRTVPGLRLVLVPRRPERFAEAAEAVRAAGLPLVRRSDHPDGAQPPPRAGPAGEPPVVLGDTMGELLKWYALAEVVFVGRSLAPMGGSNPMEPGALAKPMVWGPAMFNFPVEAPALCEAGAAVEVARADGLARTLADLLTDAERRRRMGRAARETIRRMQGATARNIALVREVLDEARAAGRRRTS